MNYAGMSDKLMAFADALTGHREGGLAQINVLLSMLMGGCSGSANADAAMECKMLVPEMEKRGYGKGFSAAITAASSCITPIIPPGINLIVYGLIAGASVGRLFAAGYLPGFVMAAALVEHESGVKVFPGAYCEAAGFQCYHPPIAALDDEKVADCKAHGIKINVWTVNDLAGLEKLYAWDADGIITNFPAAPLAFLAARR